MAVWSYMYGKVIVMEAHLWHPDFSAHTIGMCSSATAAGHHCYRLCWQSKNTGMCVASRSVLRHRDFGSCQRHEHWLPYCPGLCYTLQWLLRVRTGRTQREYLIHLLESIHCQRCQIAHSGFPFPATSHTWGAASPLFFSIPVPSVREQTSIKAVKGCHERDAMKAKPEVIVRLTCK